MRLRYYADSSYEDDHRTVLELLRDVHDEWEIPVEIVRIRERHGTIDAFPGKIREDSIESAFENDFEYNRDLSRNTGHTPKDAYQTTSGLITIAGCVGMFDGGLLWSTMLSGEPPETHSGGAAETYSISLLRDVLVHGRPAMEEKLTGGDGSADGSERGLVEEFVYAEPIGAGGEDRVLRDETVGNSTTMDTDLSAGARGIALEIGTRTVPAIVQSDRDWIVAVEDQFDASSFDETLGEVLVADHLYRADEGLAPERTRPTILFGEFPGGVRLSDEPELLGEIAAIAERFGVEVFVGVEPEEIGARGQEFLRLTADAEVTKRA
jgi:hypothetical protein